MKKIAVLCALTGLVTVASPARASHDCTHPNALVGGRLAVGVAPVGGESHWYRVTLTAPSRIQIWNVGSQTAMQLFTDNCATLICNTAQLGGTCLTNGGNWRVRVWSNGGSEYAVTVTPVV